MNTTCTLLQYKNGTWSKIFKRIVYQFLNLNVIKISLQVGIFFLKMLLMRVHSNAYGGGLSYQCLFSENRILQGIALKTVFYCPISLLRMKDRYNKLFSNNNVSIFFFITVNIGITSVDPISPPSRLLFERNYVRVKVKLQFPGVVGSIISIQFYYYYFFLTLFYLLSRFS